MRRMLLTLATVAALAPTALAQTEGVSAAMTPVETGYAPINGLEMYYEIHGDGEPLIMIHGGIGASEAFGENLVLLARSHRLIVPHLQGHGRTRDIDRPLRYEQMADDIAALIAHLDLSAVDIMGYSMGAGVALQTAIRHPEQVDRLVIVSTTMARDGWYPEGVEAFLNMSNMAPELGANLSKSPLAELYPEVQWETLFRKIGEMGSEPFDWTDEVGGIAAPALLVFADADAVRPEHLVSFYNQFGGLLRDGGLDGSGRSPSQLAIIPNTTHYNIMQSLTVGQFATEFLAQ